jgi:flagellar basal body-associated protein FliL
MIIILLVVLLVFAGFIGFLWSLEKSLQSVEADIEYVKLLKKDTRIKYLQDNSGSFAQRNREITEQKDAAAKKKLDEKNFAVLNKRVNCVLSDWSDFGACIESSKSRSRNIMTSASFGGLECGSLVEVINC